MFKRLYHLRSDVFLVAPGLLPRCIASQRLLVQRCDPNRLFLLQFVLRLGMPVGMARSCAFNWSTSCDTFMFRILVVSSASCCASMNNLSSPAKSPQLLPDVPATERAVAKLAGREEDMF